MAVKYLAGNRLIGSNSDRSSFTTTNLLSGSQWLETDTNDIYHWDGSSWDLIAGDTIAQTLTNKTLTSPTIGTSLLIAEDATIIFEGATASANETTLTVVDPTADRIVSLPNATDTLVGKATTDTFTNKTIVHASGGNSITGLLNASIANSAGIVNSKLAGPSIILSDGSNTSNIAHGATATFAATSNQTTVVQSSSTVTIGIATNPTLSGNVSITGNLTVSGDTVTHNVGAVVIEDSLLSLASANSANSIDLGWYGKYVSSGTKWAGMFWDAGTGNFYARTAMTSEPSATWSGGSAAGINVGAITAAAITGTTIDATTNFTIGDTVITNGVITDSSGLALVANVTVTGNLLPNADDTYDLGSASAAWQDLFLEGDITLTDAGTIATSAGNLTLNPDGNIVYIGASNLGTKTLIIAGDATGAVEGGELQLEIAADYDSSYAAWILDAYEDDFRILQTGAERLRFTTLGSNFDFQQATTISTSTGVLTIDGDDGIVLQTTGSGDITSNDNVVLIDSAKLSLGTGSDSQIYYDATDTIWDLAAVGSGQLLITEDAIIVPEGVVHIFSGAAPQGATPNANADELVLEGSGNVGISILTGTSGYAQIYFRDGTSNSGVFGYNHNNTRFEFTVENATQLYWSDGVFALQKETTISTDSGALNLDAATEVHINSGGIDRDFKVGNNAIDELLWIDGESARFIGIGGQPQYGVIIDSKLTLSSTGSHHVGFFEHPTVTLGAYHDYAGIKINPAITEASSYEHTDIYGIDIMPFTVTNGGGSETVINLAGLHVSAPIAGTTPTNGPYAIFVDAGNSRFDGDVDVVNLKVAGAQGSDGQVLTSTGSGVGWEDAGGGATVIRKTADQTVNNSTTFVNDTHLLFAVGANEVWEFTLEVLLDGNTTADFKTIFTVPTGTDLQGNTNYTTIYGAHHGALFGVNAWETDMTPSPAIQGPGSPTAGNGKLVLVLNAIVMVGGTAGNVQFQWAQNTADASDTIVKENSLMITRQIV